MLKVIASSVATLDSNVHTGGGTDVTDALQKVLDMAPENGGVHLVMDGAALIHGLKIHSNTTIECVSSDCGFYMADYANRPILSNYNWNAKTLVTSNVSLIGGTYNHNCTHQVHDVSTDDFPLPPPLQEPNNATRRGIMLMEFYGMENLTLRSILFKNQRVYTFCLGNFKNVIIENCTIDMAEHVHPSNQDGFHFFGPGRFLTMRNIRGCTGDDFINLAPDEMDGESSITDVLIDGVIFDDVCQGIRMLSKGTGRLDRVTVRNVTGTYRTFAFSIQPFYRGNTFGSYGDIFIENVNVRQLDATYHYTPLSFMELGGDVDSITLKNVRFLNPARNNLFLDLGRAFFYRPKELTEEEIEKYGIYDGEDLSESIYWMPDGVRPTIRNFTLDSVEFDSDSHTDDMDYISLKHNINNLTVRNVRLFRQGDVKVSGTLIRMANEAKLDNLFLEGIYAEKIESIISGVGEHSVDMLYANGVILKGGKKVFDTDDVNIKIKITENINEIN